MEAIDLEASLKAAHFDRASIAAKVQNALSGWDQRIGTSYLLEYFLRGAVRFLEKKPREKFSVTSQSPESARGTLHGINVFYEMGYSLAEHLINTGAGEETAAIITEHVLGTALQVMTGPEAESGYLEDNRRNTIPGV